MKKRLSFAAAAALAGSALLVRAASAQELSPAAFSGALARISALKRAVQVPPAAPKDGAGPISYDEMAKSFDAAPAAGSLNAFLGAWFEVAEADSQQNPGRYDPSGFFDWLHPGQPNGVAGKLIPAKPPIQPNDAYEMSWGHFDKTGKSYAADDSLVLTPDGKGAYVHIPGHMEDDPISCTNCGDGGPGQHWVDDQVYEFRVVGAQKDFLIEKAVSGGNFNAKTGAVTGGDVSYDGYRAAR